MTKNEILNTLRGGLIVSCQGLSHEPMHSSYIMQRFAVAAMEGGAVGIRANTTEDITEIKKEVSAPIISIIKEEYDDSEVYITPTKDEIRALAECGAQIIATDATERRRPGGVTLEELVRYTRENYPDVLLMADCATYEDAVRAEALGFDFIGTTLRGYTKDTAGTKLPDFKFIKKLVKTLKTPIIAEGGISTPAELRRVMHLGVLCAVVGGAITRPQNITRSFTNALK